MNSALEKYLMKMAGGLGKAKGAAEWAVKEHPMASAALGGGAAAGGLAAALGDDDDDDLGAQIKGKLGGLVDQGSEGLQELLKKIGLR